VSELQTTVTVVAVYPDRARVTRSGTATLEPGVHRLEVVELPLSLDPASVRVSARGTARARLLGLDVRRQFYAQVPTERVRELEGQVEALQDEMGGLDAQVELLKREQAALGELAGQTESYARGLAFGKTTADAHMTLLDRLRVRAEGLNAALVDAGARRREMERRLQKLQGELDLLRGARGYERYTAIIEIEVVQAGELAVALTYGVSDAGWQPLYDVRLVEEGERRLLEVGYLAQVTQRAGEDWAAVALTLSTARPALAETLPELDPWYVGPVEALRSPPAPAAMGAEGGLARMALAAAPLMEAAMAGAGLMAEVAAPAVLEAAVATAAVAGLPGSLGAAVTYQVPGTATIPADGAPHKVTVARFELAPELDYVTAPKLVETAYRRAKVTNDSPYTLLPGAANLFAGDTFIGTTELELVAPQGEVELYLGADERVKVERELKRREVDKRFIGDRRRLSYGYEITLENLLPVEAQVILHDQIPVPRHEDVKVKLEFADPKPTQQTELNLLNWELTLAAGESRTVRFDFTVEYPRTMSLMGLP
jgi:uncharacterized protein (TIGR02231 family)